MSRTLANELVRFLFCFEGENDFAFVEKWTCADLKITQRTRDNAKVARFPFDHSKRVEAQRLQIDYERSVKLGHGREKVSSRRSCAGGQRGFFENWPKVAGLKKTSFLRESSDKSSAILSQTEWTKFWKIFCNIHIISILICSLFVDLLFETISFMAFVSFSFV